jgi:hypothetical protein
MAWLDGLDPHGFPIVPPAAEDGTDVSGYSVLGVAHAVGEQHYFSTWSEEKQHLVWELEGPTAVLTDAYTGEMVASHGGGASVGGPTWTALSDNSTVQAGMAPGFSPEKYPDRIPPLKLYTKSGSGGVMGRVEVIQRLQTSGGHPGPDPEGGVEAPPTKAVPYSATYVFWGTLPDPAPPLAHGDEYASAEHEGHELEGHEGETGEA